MPVWEALGRAEVSVASWSADLDEIQVMFWLSFPNLSLNYSDPLNEKKSKKEYRSFTLLSFTIAKRSNRDGEKKKICPAFPGCSLYVPVGIKP